jgi:hypothetical protein
MRELFDRIKWYLATVVGISVSATALGMTVDRPAFYLGDVKPLEEQIAMNTNQVGCMHLDILQAQVFAAEDRYNANKTQSNLDRLRDARLRLSRAKEKGYVCS